MIASEDPIRPPESPPLVERMCRLILSYNNNEVNVCQLTVLLQAIKLIRRKQSSELLRLHVKIIEGFCMMVISDPDASTLVAEKSILVPTLILILERESSKIWGVHEKLYSVQE